MTVPQIIGDSCEEAETHKRFVEEFGDNYSTTMIGIWDCDKECIRFKLKKKILCVKGEKAELFNDLNFERIQCKEGCEHKKYIQVADFTNDIGSFWAERKRVDDCYHSVKSGRFYEQLDKLDEFFSGNKFFILEGDPSFKYMEDSHSPFRLDTKGIPFRKKSPIDQLVALMSGNEQWAWSVVKECVQRNINFIQTKNIEETIKFIKYINEGAGTTPKIRIVPKRHAGITIEQNLLILIKGIGEKKSMKMLEKFKTFPKLLDFIRSLTEDDVKDNKLLLELWEVFVKGRNTFPLKKVKK